MPLCQPQDQCYLYLKQNKIKLFAWEGVSTQVLDSCPAMAFFPKWLYGIDVGGGDAK